MKCYLLRGYNQTNVLLLIHLVIYLFLYLTGGTGIRLNSKGSQYRDGNAANAVATVLNRCLCISRGNKNFIRPRGYRERTRRKGSRDRDCLNILARNISERVTYSPACSPMGGYVRDEDEIVSLPRKRNASAQV